MLGRKRLMDAVRMIAYRAETALCGLLRSPAIDTTAARRILQDLFMTEADIRPDATSGHLHIEVHRGSRPAVDRALENLLSQLNEMEIVFPGTELTLHYDLTTKPAPLEPKDDVNPTSQEQGVLKLDLAPLIDAMNETMQGLSGNEFGPRR